VLQQLQGTALLLLLLLLLLLQEACAEAVQGSMKGLRGRCTAAAPVCEGERPCAAMGFAESAVAGGRALAESYIGGGMLLLLLLTT
jgi:hypothetical protein